MHADPPDVRRPVSARGLVWRPGATAMCAACPLTGNHGDFP